MYSKGMWIERLFKRRQIELYPLQQGVGLSKVQVGEDARPGGANDSIYDLDQDTVNVDGEKYSAAEVVRDVRRQSSRKPAPPRTAARDA